MAIDNFVGIHPKRIRTLAELEGIMLKINNYEKTMRCKGGVVLNQNNQLGASYIIVSEEEAIEGINNPGKAEFYVKFYTRSYFEELGEYIKAGKEPDYNGLNKRHTMSWQDLKSEPKIRKPEYST